MENETIRTKASVSITVKNEGNYFKIETDLNNELGVSESEINNERMQVHDLVTAAIEDYKQVKDHVIENISYKIADIKQMIEVKKQQKEDPAIIDAIKKMPEYKPKKA